jgi:hypothetical protein
MPQNRKTGKLKGAQVDAKTVDEQHPRRLQPGAQGAGTRTKGKLQENRRQRLNVGPDHKTPSMQKGRRGSFP